LVYNVGNGGGSSLTAAQALALDWLTQHYEDLKGVIALTVDFNTVDIDITPYTEDLQLRNAVIPVKKQADGSIEIIQDIDDIDNNGDTTEYLINVPGFVCGVECHTWVYDSNRTG
jgi:hypothetical protein